MVKNEKIFKSAVAGPVGMCITDSLLTAVGRMFTECGKFIFHAL